jgi:hypothetical protein
MKVNGTKSTDVTFTTRSATCPPVYINDLNSRVQHPVPRVSIGFINVTTVRNYFLLLYY